MDFKYKKYKTKYFKLKKELELLKGGDRDCSGRMRNYCNRENCMCSNFIQSQKCFSCGHHVNDHNQASVNVSSDGKIYEVPIEQDRVRK